MFGEIVQLLFVFWVLVCVLLLVVVGPKWMADIRSDGHGYVRNSVYGLGLILGWPLVLGWALLVREN